MPSDIVAVEERHIRPVVGEALYGALAEGRYADLMEEYVAPAIAAWGTATYTAYISDNIITYTCNLI